MYSVCACTHRLPPHSRPSSSSQPIVAGRSEGFFPIAWSRRAPAADSDARTTNRVMPRRTASARTSARAFFGVLRTDTSVVSWTLVLPGGPLSTSIRTRSMRPGSARGNSSQALRFSCCGLMSNRSSRSTLPCGSWLVTRTLTPSLCGSSAFVALDTGSGPATSSTVLTVSLGMRVVNRESGLPPSKAGCSAKAATEAPRSKTVMGCPVETSPLVF